MFYPEVPVIWFWLGLASLPILVLVFLMCFHQHVKHKYLPMLVRILQEKPLFIVPHGVPLPDAEDVENVEIPTTHGLFLRGCYLRTSKPRKGVILFGLEFGSNRWSARPYCEFLLENGYNVFSFETRGQGQTPSQAGYEPMVWVTEFEVDDFRAALAYLKERPDGDPRGVGFFGLSKGGSAGLYVACEDPFVRCCVTDGIFATHTTMVPYMLKWIFIYSTRPWLPKILPLAYYRYVAHIGLDVTSRECHCTFPHLEWRIRNLAPRPLLMIHGGADPYIKPAMAQSLFELAGGLKELWIVDGAKHNQAFSLVGAAYKERILGFFDQHLSGLPTPDVSEPATPEDAVDSSALVPMQT